MLEGGRAVGDPSLSLPEREVPGLEGHHHLGFGVILDRNEEIRGVLCATNIEQLVEVERVVPGERGGDTAFGRPAANLSEHWVREGPSGFGSGIRPVERPPCAAGRAQRFGEQGDARAEEIAEIVGIGDPLGLDGQLEHHALRGP